MVPEASDKSLTRRGAGRERGREDQLRPDQTRSDRPWKGKLENSNLEDVLDQLQQLSDFEEPAPEEVLDWLMSSGLPNSSSSTSMSIVFSSCRPSPHISPPSRSPLSPPSAPFHPFSDLHFLTSASFISFHFRLLLFVLFILLRLKQLVLLALMGAPAGGSCFL